MSENKDETILCMYHFATIVDSLEEDDTIAPLPLSRELDMQLASSSNLSEFVRDSNGYNGSSTIGFGRPLSETRKISVS